MADPPQNPASEPTTASSPTPKGEKSAVTAEDGTMVPDEPIRVLGRFLCDHGSELRRATDGLEEIARKFAPFLPGHKMPADLAARLDALQESIEKRKTIDPFDCVQQEQEETLVRKLERIERFLQDRLDSPGRAVAELKAATAQAGRGRDGDLAARLEQSFQIRMDRLTQTLDQVKTAVMPAARSEAPPSTFDELRSKVGMLQGELQTQRQEAKTAREEVAGLQAETTIQARQIDRMKAEQERWRLAALGPDLSRDESCRAQCDELIEAALRGDDSAAAVALLGQIMSFQAGSRDRLPNLLKDVGEAFYAWRPRTQPGPADDDPLETALIRAMLARCEKQGVRNKIDTVRPNARFNSDRHRSEAGGGTTVYEVRGWVVLRENGQTLHRATVVTR